MLKFTWKRRKKITQINIGMLITLILIVITSVTSNTKNNSTSVSHYEERQNVPNTTLSKSENSKIQNSYPKECPRKNNMSEFEMQENNICILRRRWKEDLRNINYNTASNFKSRRSYEDIKNFKSDREYTNPKNEADCLLSVRSVVRYFPGKCYTRVFQYGITTAAIKNAFEESWWNFATEVLGDIMYTFDFILWSPGPFPDEYNQFWFLILYLRELVNTFESPMEVVGRTFHEAYMKQLKDKLTMIIDELKKRQNDYQILSHTLKELKVTMASYQAMMSELQDKMKNVVSMLPLEQTNRQLLLEKLDNIGDAANKLQDLFRRSNIKEILQGLEKQANTDEAKNTKSYADQASNIETESSDDVTNDKRVFAG